MRSLVVMVVGTVLLPWALAMAQESGQPEFNAEAVAALRAGFAALDAGDFASALEQYGLASQKAESDVVRFQAALGTGTAASELARYAEAIDALEQARALLPDHPAVLLGLGRALIASGRNDEAVPVLERAVAVEPGHAEAELELAREYTRQKNLVKAVAAARGAVRGLPGSAEAYIVLGIATSQAMLLDDAVAAFQAAIELQPENPRAHFGLGMCFVTMGREPEAVLVADTLHGLDRALAKELIRELR